MCEEISVGTRILATIGPACDTPEMIETLIREGVSCFRLNFSHGTHQSHTASVQRVRAAAERVGMPIAIMGDLCGPKLRLTDVENEELIVQEGDVLTFIPGDGVCSRTELFINHFEWLNRIEPGHPVLIDDGRIRLRCRQADVSGIHCIVEFGGTLLSRKGVNLPETRLGINALSPKDKEDIAWAVENRLDCLALSFVCSQEDIAQLRKELQQYDSSILVIAKIETHWAVQNLDSILDAADAVLVARGDLGVEIEVENVPYVQKQVSRKARSVGKPTILATQMLHSMVSSATPNRAEVSDIANAIYDGFDGLLLTNETAAGKYPQKAVEIIRRIAKATVRNSDPALSFNRNSCCKELGNPAVAQAIEIAGQTGAKGFILFLDSKSDLQVLNRNRFSLPVVVLTSSSDVYRTAILSDGMNPVLLDSATEEAASLRTAEQEVIRFNIGRVDDQIVIIRSGTADDQEKAWAVGIHTLGSKSS